MQSRECIHLDPALWDLFTCTEEYTSPWRDRHGRFPYYLSRNRSIFSPLVSRYLVEKGMHPVYPEGRPFALCLSHDIDFIAYPMRNLAASAALSLARGKPGKAWGTMRAGMNRKQGPLRNFRQIMALEKKYGAVSSFYFLAAENGEPDFSYALDQVAPDLQGIAESGWEVGLHASRLAHKDPIQLAREIQRLQRITGSPVLGCRMHYLAFSVPETWDTLAKAGIRYDASLGYNDCAGFRNGTCHPFRPFDVRQNREMAIIEIPLHIMDKTLFHDYMDLSIDTAWDLTRHLIDETARCHGVASVLWHNTSMEGEYGEFYEKILRYGKEKNAWMTSGREVWQWYCHQQDVSPGSLP
ncbi:MAG: polysaccharide deacetylase family protein [Methanomicrobiales archaeon]|nr:polysaccharide deacetylase family protein [Methanomicrobiales archaeon]